MGDPQPGEQWYQRSPCTVVKVLGPTSGSPAWRCSQGAGHARVGVEGGGSPLYPIELYVSSVSAPHSFDYFSFVVIFFKLEI